MIQLKKHVLFILLQQVLTLYVLTHMTLFQKRCLNLLLMLLLATVQLILVLLHIFLTVSSENMNALNNFRSFNEQHVWIAAETSARLSAADPLF